jgi:uncharacterized GH25 family protein
MNSKSFFPRIERIVLGVVVFGAVSLFAHYTWLLPTSSIAKIGGIATVRIANGHSFPSEGEPVKDIDLKMIILDPAGKSVALKMVDKGKGLEASFKTEIEGVYRVASEYDRGIISRTPEGWKPGGKSKNPNATSVLKSYNSFISAVRTSSAPFFSASPMGLAFEISWARNGHKLVALVTTKGTAVENAELSVIIGSGDAKSMGKTDSAGRIAFEIPNTFKGPILLMGSISKPMPANADYDAERMSSSYYLNWE